MKSLNKLVPGEKAFIVDMRNPKLCEKFFELGVFPGDMVEVKENSSDRNCLVIAVNNNTYNIYKKAAESIITNIVSLEYSRN